MSRWDRESRGAQGPAHSPLAVLSPYTPPSPWGVITPCYRWERGTARAINPRSPGGLGSPQGSQFTPSDSSNRDGLH